MKRRLALAFLVAAGCTHPAPPPPVPAPAVPATTPSRPAAATPVVPSLPTEDNSKLPPIPLVTGPLAIHVVFPAEGSPVAPTDSEYLLGSVGNGHAALTINGHPAVVYPNGAFMAFVPNATPANPKFDLVATLGADTTRFTQPLRPPLERLPVDGKLIVDTSEFFPRASANLFLRDSDRTTLSLHIPANATAAYVSPSRVIPLARNGETASRTVFGTDLRLPGAIVVARNGDTVRVPVTAVTGPRLDLPVYVRLGKGMSVNDTDAVIYGRTLPNENYKWFMLPGTVAEETGRNGTGYTRIRVAEDLEMWVADADVDSMVPRPARRTTSNGRIRSTPLSADFVLPVTSTPPFFVEEEGNEVDLVLYGVIGNTDIVNYATNDSLIRAVTWEQEAVDHVRFRLHLTQRPYGYMVLREGGNLILRVRRIPTIDPLRPLRGRTIALDPGHPPSGATGPTSLYEGQAVLWVAEAAKSMLEAKGATVVMTRTTMDTLGLPPRRTIPRRADAEAFVSIHLNAYPDGVNPFVASHGSGTYFFRTHSEPLARAVQQHLLAQMSLHDEGTFYRSLAVTVQTWMPAVLTEGAFVIIPEQEAALRTTAFQERYARAVVDGLESYFRALAR
jgi:N-acetylmuramoyl-L-alanine amidase